MTAKTIWATIILLMSLLLLPTVLMADGKSKFDEEIRTTLNTFAVRYNKKDIKGIMKLFANDKEVTTIGLCEKQEGMGQEGIKAVFEKDLLSFKGSRTLIFKNIAIGNYGFISWLSTDVYPYATMDDGRSVPGVKARLTAVLRKIRGAWKFLQMHVSVPADVKYQVTAGDLNASGARR